MSLERVWSGGGGMGSLKLGELDMLVDYQYATSGAQCHQGKSDRTAGSCRWRNTMAAAVRHKHRSDRTSSEDGIRSKRQGVEMQDALCTVESVVGGVVFICGLRWIKPRQQWNSDYIPVHLRHQRYRTPYITRGHHHVSCQHLVFLYNHALDSARTNNAILHSARNPPMQTNWISMRTYERHKTHRRTPKMPL